MRIAPLLALAACVVVVAQYPPQCQLPDGGEQMRLKVTAQLDAMGYTVSRGHLNFNSTCTPITVNCIGQNPSSPYGTWKMETPLFLNTSEIFWQIRNDEAFVFYGCTPPPSRYFSWDVNVLISKWNMQFASVGDAQNHLTINHSLPDGVPPFNTETLMMTTGDQVTQAAVYDAFRASGVPPSVFNTVPIPDTRALGIDPLGEGLGHSILVMIYRVALCLNETECHAYQHSWLPILRVTPKQRHVPRPFPLYPLRPRGTNRTEAFLAADLQRLLAAVGQRYNATHRQQSQDDLLALPLDGRDCIRNNSHCVGATRDALYFDGTEPLFAGARRPAVGEHNVSPQYVLTNDPDDFPVVCGVLHAKAGKATYTNLAPYFVEREMATGAVVDEKLAGSAAQYMSGGNTDLLYAYMFKRDCGSTPFCTTIPHTGFPSIPLSANLTFVERAYLEPATRVGPLYTELLHPVILHYRGKI